MKYTLHFQDERTGLQVTLQADSFEKIADAFGRYTSQPKLEGKPKKVLTKN